eukprot:3135727-Pleurochrysis_carterae.AAC.1
MTPGTPASDIGPADKDRHRTPSVPSACQNEPSACLEREQSPLDPTKTQRSRDCRTRGSCVDLCIASNPRALTVTRQARLSDRHTRGLRSHALHRIDLWSRRPPSALCRSRRPVAHGPRLTEQTAQLYAYGRAMRTVYARFVTIVEPALVHC